MLNPRDTFWWYINERHRIYIKKEAGGAWPWTKDSILQQYSFCNIFRELDKVTIAFRELLGKPYANHNNLWFAYCLARAINWPPTVERICRETNFPVAWDPPTVYETMRALQKEGAKVYTGAYMVRGDIQREGDTDNNKPKYTVFGVLHPVFLAYKCMSSQARNEAFATIESFTKWLERFPGWGGFMSYEVATDLRHTRFLRQAPDIMTFANPGPGAVRGLNRIALRAKNKHLTREFALAEMKQLLEDSPKYLEKHVPALEMRDIEHTLCEVDKYLRVATGEGRPRAKYHPPIEASQLLLKKEPHVSHNSL